MKKFTKRLWEKKNSRKGFTLVELIVVLVILAILAAMMIPALTGWIDQAKQKQITLEARTVYLAAQTVASVDYANDTNACFGIDGKLTSVGKGAILKLAELEDAIDLSVKVNSSSKITSLEYKSESGYTATLDDGQWIYKKTT